MHRLILYDMLKFVISIFFLQNPSRNHASLPSLPAVAIFSVKIERNFCSVKREVSKKYLDIIRRAPMLETTISNTIKNPFSSALPRHYTNYLSPTSRSKNFIH